MSRRDRGESRQKVLADALHTEKQVSLALAEALQHYMMRVEMLEKILEATMALATISGIPVNE